MASPASNKKSLRPPHLEWVKPPLQARSHKTLERILDAAEALLIEGGADAVTMAMVARRARSSVGSLYARFDGKDALLRSVFERFLDQARATIEQAIHPDQWVGAPLATIFEHTLTFTVGVFSQKRQLIAALTIHTAQSPSTQGILDQLGARIADGFYQLLRDRDASIAHPDPARAIRFTTWTLLGFLEAHALHPNEPGTFSGSFSDRDIITEGMRMFMAYLGIDDTTPR